jgi:CO/xanthine dehydrogenase Mo-binding subunit
VDRQSLAIDDRIARTLLDTCAPASVESELGCALAGARVDIDDDGSIARVSIRVAAGDPLDDVVLRSYAVGAAHMALGWVLNEALTVDPETGEIHDLTIRSFGVVRAQDTPEIDIEIVDDDGPPLARASDAVFAAVAAATWNAITRADGARPDAFPASDARAARRLRR